MTKLNVQCSVGRYVVHSASETFTIPPGGGSYRVANGEFYVADDDVAIISEEGSVPMRWVETNPGKAEYNVHVLSGTYSFAPSDAGRQVVVAYVWYNFLEGS